VARQYRLAAQASDLELERNGGTLILRTADRELVVEDFSIGERYVTVVVGGRSHRYLYAREAGHVHIADAGHSLCLIPADEEAEDCADSAGFTPAITAPMPGKVLEVMAVVGDELEAGAPLLLLEAMKMEQTIRTATPARVVEVHVQADAMVGPGETLVTLAPLED
jgi:acetyl-CoA/propionyl-CoA carboxylase biotin carboxyl carrier protein